MQVAEAAFQLAIVLSSIAIIAKARPLLQAGGGLGAVGLLGLLNGYYLWVNLPI